MSNEFHVLVVDDFASMRHLISTMLNQIGYRRTSQAEDGVDALRLLRSTHENALSIDIVITDWNMPNMDGLTLLTEMRKDSRLLGLPVLMVTAEAKKENILSAARAGADGYLLKPFTAVTLQQKLDAILQRRGLLT